ncbi:MAG: class I SAM-dependent methyltransferase [Bacteroidales bacterium]
MDYFKFIKPAFRYFIHQIKAGHKAGHGIHSPFIFDFLTKVVFISEQKDKYKSIDNYKKDLISGKGWIEITDFGAGSVISRNRLRKVKNIAKYSSTKPKYGKLLARMISYFKPSVILEIGTSVGIGTAYLSKNMHDSCVLYTLEGDPKLFQLASEYFIKSKILNIRPISGNFDETLPELVSQIEKMDFVYFDGNHRKDATIRYFETCLEKQTNESVFIFDDIHWSDEMEQAWDYICCHPKSKVCIDLFQIGIVFFRKELSCEKYLVRF